jgi:hypothetical protein
LSRRLGLFNSIYCWFVLPPIFLGCSFSIFNLSMAWEASRRLTEGLIMNLETDDS